MAEKESMNITEKLMNIQSKLKAPKNQRNDFGKYNYRSCEDILEEVKPLLSEFKCAMTLNDEIVVIGERIYVKATATLTDVEKPTEHITNSAYAREAEVKKGQDESQITGATSSYARKYALNGLFLIDDNKDADTNEYKNEAENKAKATATVKAPAPKKVEQTETQTEEQAGDKPVISEESKALRRKFVKYCTDHQVDWKKYGLNNDSTDQAFKDALHNAKAEVAERDGELPFELTDGGEEE